MEVQTKAVLATSSPSKPAAPRTGGRSVSIFAGRCSGRRAAPRGTKNRVSHRGYSLRARIGAPSTGGRTALWILLLTACGAGCPWPEDNPHDPLRCQPVCGPGYRCRNGVCQAFVDARPDGPSDVGGAEAGTDRGQDRGRDRAADTLAPPVKWSWATAMTGAANDAYSRKEAMTTGPGGRVYVAGTTDSAALTVGGKVLSSTVRVRKLFVAMLDGAGEAQWIWAAHVSGAAGSSFAANVGGIAVDRAGVLAVDSAGDPHLAGRFSSPSLAVGGTTLTNTGGADLLAAKLGDGDGKVIWASSAGGAGDEWSQATVITAQGMAICGYTTSTPARFGSTLVSSRGQADIVLTQGLTTTLAHNQAGPCQGPQVSEAGGPGIRVHVASSPSPARYSRVEPAALSMVTARRFRAAGRPVMVFTSRHAFPS